MRAVEHTSRFRRDHKREKSGRRAKRLDPVLLETVTPLATDEPLARRHFDHPLSGEWNTVLMSSATMCLSCRYISFITCA